MQVLVISDDYSWLDATVQDGKLVSGLWSPFNLSNKSYCRLFIKWVSSWCSILRAGLFLG